jgi:2-keto-3-deoxy-6-phosphogluconate aldolase
MIHQERTIMELAFKQLIEEYKIIAIVRKIYGNDLVQLAQALYAGGIRMLEITFDQSDPIDNKHGCNSTH